MWCSVPNQTEYINFKKISNNTIIEILIIKHLQTSALLLVFLQNGVFACSFKIQIYNIYK